MGSISILPRRRQRLMTPFGCSARLVGGTDDTAGSASLTRIESTLTPLVVPSTLPFCLLLSLPPVLPSMLPCLSLTPLIALPLLSTCLNAIVRLAVPNAPSMPAWLSLTPLIASPLLLTCMNTINCSTCSAQYLNWRIPWYVQINVSNANPSPSTSMLGRHDFMHISCFRVVPSAVHVCMHARLCMR
ncbi:hypothetical protein SCLCIDRAFT_991761 [Scleroderma citrinum Foug A]|uniref:Uncharacterized protein n=1 Tax=Scleroderma citrinum Foug A TaxID=1036808 RepID=A0A0C3DU15_9AGAM|nr:hypothetical protein SCLCIDRAFT_991761 [Scleroderma citrinum Foug A]